jgi:hypothetical protein
LNCLSESDIIMSDLEKYMAGYSREFLIAAFMSRYVKSSLISIEKLVELEQIAERTYDTYGKDQFRAYASLDADAIKLYKSTLK